MNAPILESENTQSIVEEGYLVDPETGEVLGLASTPTPEFEVTDVDSAEWVLAKIGEADAEILKLQLMLNGSIERMTKRIKAQQRRSDYLRARFEPGLTEVARKNLPKSGKTWNALNGSVAFRATKDRVDVPKENTDQAIGWLKKKGLNEAIKTTESILKDSIPKEVKEELIADAELRKIAGFELIPGGESVKIETVKAGKE